MSNKSKSSTSSSSLLAPPATPPSASSSSTPLATPPRKLETTVDTPGSMAPGTEPDSVYDCFFYVQDSGTLEMKPSGTKSIELYIQNLWNSRGLHYQIQAWGPDALDMHQFFGTAVDHKGHHLFQILTDLLAIDPAVPYLKKHHPNQQYEKDLEGVFKLTQHDKKLKKKALNAQSFPKLVSWKDDFFFLADGRRLPHYTTWPHLAVEEPYDWDDAFDVKEMVVEQPFKKARK